MNEELILQSPSDVTARSSVTENTHYCASIFSPNHTNINRELGECDIIEINSELVCSDDSDDDDESLSILVTFGVVPGLYATDYQSNCRKQHSSNKYRQFITVFNRFNGFYFSEESTFSDKDFECHFGMSRLIFAKILKVLEGGGLFVMRKNAMWQDGIITVIRIISAPCIMAYGMSYDPSGRNS